jgi:hypothetical protein
VDEHDHRTVARGTVRDPMAVEIDVAELDI